MVTRRAVVVNETGIHARPASNLINEAKKFKSKITIRNLSRSGCEAVNAKSIMMVLSLAIAKNMTVEISAEGADEAQAAETLGNFIESGLNE